MGKKRAWYDITQEQIDPIELDENNLPEFKPVVTTSPNLQGPKSDNVYYETPELKLRYDKLIGQGESTFDEEDLAAAVMPRGQAFGRGFVSRGASILPKTLQSIGHIAGAIEYGADYLTYGEEADPMLIFDNALSRRMNEMDEGLRKSLPIYKSYYGRYGNIGQQMRDKGFWADDVFDSMAFLASAAIIGGTSGTLMKSLAFSQPFLKTAEGMMQGQKAMTYVSTAFNTLGESGVEAYDFGQQERDNMAMSQYGRQYQYLDPESKRDIRNQVGDYQAQVYRANLGVLLVPNYIQSRFMFGSAGKAAGQLRQAVFTGKLSSADVNVLWNAAKDMGTGAISEGLWEEGMQNAITTYAGRQGDSQMDLNDYSAAIADEWLDNLETPEGQKNIILGGMIGSLFGGFGSVRQSREYVARIKEQEEIYDRLKSTLDINDRWLIEYITKPYVRQEFESEITDPETGEVTTETIQSYLRKDGTAEYDMEAVQKMFMYTLGNKFLFDEAMAATIKADNVHLDMVNNDALARLFYRYITNPDVVNIEEATDLLLQRDLQLPQELVDEGYVQNYTMQDLQPMIDAYKETESELMDRDDFRQDKKALAFKRVLGKTLFIEKVRRNFYEKLKERVTPEQAEQIDRLIEDSLKTENQIKDKKTRDKLYEDYKSETQTYEDALNKMRQLETEEGFKKREDFLRAVYDKQEFEALNGKQNPYSTRFIFEYMEGLATDQRGFGPAAMSNEFGTRYNYYLNIGRHESTKAKMNKAIGRANKSGRSSVNDIVQLASGILSGGGIITSEEAERINQAVEKRQRGVDKLSNEEVNRREIWKSTAPEVEMYEMDQQTGNWSSRMVPNPNYDINEHLKQDRWLKEYQARKADLEQAVNDIRDVNNRVEKGDKSLPREYRRQYRKFQRDFADEPIRLAKNVIESYESNPDSYSDAVYVSDILLALQNRQTVYNTPGRKQLLRTKEFNGFKEELDETEKKLSDVLKGVEKNAAKRREADRKSMVNYGRGLFNSIGISIDRENGTFTIENQALYDVIESVVGKEFLDRILKKATNAKREGFDYSFDGIFVERIIHEVKKSKEGTAKVLALLESQRSTHIQEFKDLYVQLPAVKSSRSKGYLIDIASYEVNPFKTFDVLLKKLVRRFSTAVQTTNPIDKFIRTKDAYELYESVSRNIDLQYNEITSEELEPVVKKHIDVISNITLRDRLESEESIANIVGRESQLLRGKTKKAPSNQQVITLRELIYNLKREPKNKGKKYSLWYYVKGLAGTGKTTMMVTRLLNFLGYTHNNITALSTHERALAVLQNNIEGKDNTGLATKVTVEQLTRKDNKIVIVDEIARLNSNDLDVLAGKIVEANKKIAEENKGLKKAEKRPSLRVVVLGDPTQVTSKDEAFSAINSLTGYIPSIKELSPLTTVFRTGNSAIIAVQNMFQDFPGEITSLMSKATAKIGKHADGVHISKRRNELIEQIKAHSKNDRTKVLVVSNPAMAREYRTMLQENDIDIKTLDEIMEYYDVAGLEFDEVYVDLNPKDFDNTRKFNDAMYTATSRAVQYIFLRSYKDEGKWDFIVDEEIPIEDFEARNREIVADYADRLSFEAEMLEDEMENVDFEAPQVVDLEEDQESDYADEQIAEDQGPAESDPLSSENVVTFEGAKPADEKTLFEGRVVKLQAPTYHAIKARRIGTAIPKPGSRVKWIKALNEDTGEIQIQIVAEKTNDDGSPLENPQWSVVGIMTQDELFYTQFGDQVREALEKVDNDLYNGLSKGNEGSLNIEDGPTILAEGKIALADPLSYKYNKDNRITENGPGFINGLINKIKQIFKDEDLSFEIKIYEISTIPEGSGLHAGIPYLLIHRKGEDQWVSLSGRYMKKTDKLIKYLQPWYDAVRELDRNGIRVGTPGVNILIRRFKDNFKVEGDEVVQGEKVYTWQKYQNEKPEYGLAQITEDQFNVLDRMSSILIPSFYGIGDVAVEVESEEDMLSYLSDAQKADKATKYEFVKKENQKKGKILARSVRNPDKAHYVTKKDLKAGEGKAQKALNIIAMANKHAPFKVRTANTTYRNNKQRRSYISTAKSLLADETTYGAYYLHLIKLYEDLMKEAKALGYDKTDFKASSWTDSDKSIASEENVNKLEEKLLEIKSVDPNFRAEQISVDEFAKTRKRFETKPVNLDILTELMTFTNGYNNYYYPLKIGFVNDNGKDLTQNMDVLEAALATKLESINRTNIEIEIDEAYRKKIPDAPEGGLLNKTREVGKKVGKAASKAKKKLEQGTKRKKSKDEIEYEERMKRRGRDRGGRRMTGNIGDLGQRITIDQAYDLLEQYVPTITSQGQPVLRFTSNSFLDPETGLADYGLYRNEAIRVIGKDGYTFVNPIRHEVFHKIFTEGLSERERINLIKDFEKRYPQHKGKSYEEIEELLAIAFHENQGKEVTGWSKLMMDFFNFISQFFRFINLNTKNLDRFFATIEGGHFRRMKSSMYAVNKPMNAIKSMFGTQSFHVAADLYSGAKNLLMDEVYEIIHNGKRIRGYELRNDDRKYPMTRSEMRSAVRNDMEYRLLENRAKITRHNNGVEVLTEDDYWDIKDNITYQRALLKNYNAIWNNVYENWKMTKAMDLEIDETLTAEDEMRELNDMANENLQQHILDSDQWNQEGKLSAIVKDFLSNIKVNRNKYIPWREAYVRMLQLLDGLRIDEAEFGKQIDQRVEQLGGHPRIRIVADEFKRLFTTANALKGRDNRLLPKNMKFTNDDVFIYNDKPFTEEVNGENKARVLGYEVIKRHKNENTANFINRIANRTDISIDQLVTMFNNHQDISTFKAIMNLMNNQQEKTFFIAETKWDGPGAYKVTYIPGSYYGVHTSIISELHDRITEKFDSKNKLKHFVNTWLADVHKQNRNNHFNFVSEFLRYFGLSAEAEVMPDIGMDKLYQDIPGFFERALEVYGTKIEVKDENDKVVDTLERDMPQIIKSDPTMISFLGRVIATSDQFMRATNVKTMDGKKRYLWSPSSFMSDVLNYLMQDYRTTKKLQNQLPAYLQTDYFKHNIFVNKFNKIHRIITNDGLRTIKFGGGVTYSPYKNETESELLTRMFSAGFIDRLKYDSKGNKKYFQWFYPNERAQAVAAEVNLLTPEKIQEGLITMVTQLNELAKQQKDGHKNSNKFINLRLVEEALKDREQSIWEKPLTKKEIERTASKVKDLLMREANILSDRLIKNEVYMDKDLPSIQGMGEYLTEFEDYNLKDIGNNNIKGRSVLSSFLKGKDGLNHYSVEAEQILPLAYIYTANDYINSFFLSQVVLGDMNQFKNEEDVIKRSGIMSAPGSRGIVHPRIGTRKTSRMLVMSDSNKKESDIRFRLDKLLKTPAEKKKLDGLMQKFEDNYDTSDGQGFMLPERFEDLKYGGFTQDYSIHDILKPVIYGVQDDGVTRGVKFSVIVLRDELVKEFPSLGNLRANMRESGYDEAVFVSGVKIGIPEATATYPDVTNPGVTFTPEMGFEFNNKDYRIQLDPKAKIESHVSQPSQLVYLINVLEQNQEVASKAYEKLARIANLGGTELFNNLNTDFRRTMLKMLAGGKGSELAFDAISEGLSENFPSITDKLITQIASNLNKRISKISFSGTKLILQSEAGVRKYGHSIDDGGFENKLQYYRDERKKRLVAEMILPEGLLPTEYENRIKEAIAKGERAEDYFETPDLLGFRIPSSDIHSAVVVKVVGFYPTSDTNVIIAPDLLVALHGSDFDVDSLFMINRYLDSEEKPVGYELKDGRYVYQTEVPEYTKEIRTKKGKKTVTDTDKIINHLKNGVLEDLLEILSAPKNVPEMIAPIPMNSIKEEKKRMIKEMGIDRSLDLSNINDKVKAHKIIWGAAAATGVFGNQGKVLAYSINAGPENESPMLKNEEDYIIIGGKPYNQLQLYDDDNENIFTSNDGFINVAIDNIKELALDVLNITGKTINAFNTLRALGVGLKSVNNFMQHPAIMDISSYHGKWTGSAITHVRKKILEKLDQKEVNIEDIEITHENLKSNLNKKIRSIDDIPAVFEDGKKNQKAEDQLLYQLKILEYFDTANKIGRDLGKLARMLKIARAIPYTKEMIDETLDAFESVFGTINDDGSLTGAEEKNFSFDMSNFFKNNHHLLEIYKNLQTLQGFVETKFKKHNPKFMNHVKRVHTLIGLKGKPNPEVAKLIQDEILSYLMANEIYSGKYAVDKDVVFTYVKDNEVKTLTGPKAVNAIFDKKIRALRSFIAKQRDENGQKIDNKFIKHLRSSFNNVTKTRSIMFDGGSNLDAEDYLEFKAAFYDLSHYDVTYDQKTQQVNIIFNNEPKPAGEYTDFQKEFVAYGILNWGLKFGAANYSAILPNDMYLEVDQKFNKIIDPLISADAEGLWDLIEDDFTIQFVVNNGEIMRDYWKEFGENLISTKKYIDPRDNRRKSFYGGKTDGYFYDRAYENVLKEKDEDGNTIIKGRLSYPDYLLTNNMDKKGVYIRMNEADALEVHYQKISNISPFSTYYFSDESRNNGYDYMDYFAIDKRFGVPIYNQMVSDMKQPFFYYNGDDLSKGDIISYTHYHDVTRVDKVYKVVKEIVGNEVLVRDLKEDEATKEGKVTGKKNDKGLEKRISFLEEKKLKNDPEKLTGRVKEMYEEEGNINDILLSASRRTSDSILKEVINRLLPVIKRQKIKVKFDQLNGARFALYNPDGTITIDLDKIGQVKGFNSISDFDQISLHEAIHGISLISYLTDQKFKKEVDTMILEYFSEDGEGGPLRFNSEAHAQMMLDLLKQSGYFQGVGSPSLSNIYGLKNKFEFISELLSNSDFANAINQVINSETQETTSLLKRIWNAILEFLGFKKAEKNIQDKMISILENQQNKPNMLRVGDNQYRDHNGRLWDLDNEAFAYNAEQESETEVIEEEYQETDSRAKVREDAEKMRIHSDQVVVGRNDDGTEAGYYIIKKTADRILRITDLHTGLRSFFSPRKIDPDKTFGEEHADRVWGDLDHDHRLETDEGNMETWEEYRDRMDAHMRFGNIKGSIIHRMLMKVANTRFNLGKSNAEIDREINDLSSRSDGEVNPDTYRWAENENVLQKIFSNAGITIFNNDVPINIRDVEYLPEVTVWSDLLGFGGTVDAAIGHSNNTWTFIDYKTSQNFNRRITNAIMKYGQQEINITDNQREHAKLQLMLYAFLAKLQNPDMKFRDLMVLWIPDQWLAERPDPERSVEVRSYLRMIEQFLSDKKALEEAGIDPNIKKKLLAKSPKIFNPGEYSAKTSETLEAELIESDLSPEQLYEKKVARLTVILSRYKEGRKVRIDELDDRTKFEVRKLIDEINRMRGDHSLQVDLNPQQEIGAFTAWLGNYSDVNMDIFQTWVKMRNNRWNTYTQKHEAELKQFESLLKPIYENYMRGKVRIKRGGIDRLALVNYPELFSFAFKEFDQGGRTRERILIETDQEYKDLAKEGEIGKAKQKFITYFNDMMEKWFSKDGYLNQKATEMQGKEFSWLDLYNEGLSPEKQMKYYRGWFPKVMKTDEEINYEEGARIMRKEVGTGQDIRGANLLGRFSKKAISEKIQHNLTWYEEDTFLGYLDEKMAIPIKYLDTYKILNNRNYSHSMMRMFDQFNKSMLHKSYMDSVYVTGQALKVYLEEKKFGNGQPMFDNVVGFLDRKLIQDVQNRVVKMKWSGKPITFGKKQISIDKIIEAMQNWTSATIMWLRPLQGGGNGLHAKMLTHREALKGTIASKFLHIDGDAIDFKVEDNIFADKIYFGSFTKDALLGNLNKNKAWLIARKLNYIPDNYDYATNRRFLLSTRNQPLNKSRMYMFHSIPEEYVSLTTMIAQLHYLKNPVTGKRLWDEYEVYTDDNGITDVRWIGGVRGFERIGKGSLAQDIEITELTDHEIEKLKKVHERMQGGYRKEEAATLEIYVLGKALLQFKKYFPRLLLNALSSKREEVALGAYKKLQDQRIYTDPETGKETKLDVYEWTRRLNEGRWRTLINAFLYHIGVSKNRDYKWSNLTSEQKQNLVDAMLTISMWGMAYSAYLMLFADEDDDDTFKKWWRNYIILNLSQQYNPYELLHTMETTMRPVSFARAWKLTESIRNMLLATANLALGNKDAALTNDGDLKGWNEFMRSIPYMASWHDFAIKISNASPTEEWWDMMWEYKWK